MTDEIDAAHLSAERIHAAAIRYAEYDKSDPFSLARCLCHIRMGLCGPVITPPNVGEAGHYEATRDNAGWRNLART